MSIGGPHEVLPSHGLIRFLKSADRGGRLGDVLRREIAGTRAYVRGSRRPRKDDGGRPPSRAVPRCGWLAPPEGFEPPTRGVEIRRSVL